MAQFDLETQTLVGRGRIVWRSVPTMKSPASWQCSSRASAKDWVRFKPPRSSASASNATFSCGRLSPNRAQALQSQKRGPKTHYRRTAEVVRQVIRHRFLDPDASPEVIAQKLCQSGWEISIRSVQRVIEEYGLQKKTLSVSTDR